MADINALLSVFNFTSANELLSTVHEIVNDKDEWSPDWFDENENINAAFVIENFKGTIEEKSVDEDGDGPVLALLCEGVNTETDKPIRIDIVDELAFGDVMENINGEIVHAPEWRL